MSAVAWCHRARAARSCGAAEVAARLGARARAVVERLHMHPDSDLGCMLRELD